MLTVVNQQECVACVTSSAMLEKLKTTENAAEDQRVLAIAFLSGFRMASRASRNLCLDHATVLADMLGDEIIEAWPELHEFWVDVKKSNLLDPIPAVRAQVMTTVDVVIKKESAP